MHAHGNGQLAAAVLISVRVAVEGVRCVLFSFSHVFPWLWAVDGGLFCFPACTVCMRALCDAAKKRGINAIIIASGTRGGAALHTRVR